MDQATEQTFAQDEKWHRRYLRRLWIGERGRNFARNGLLFLSGSIIITAYRIITHGFILLILQGFFQQWFFSVATYVALHGILWIIFGSLRKHSDKMLKQLQEQYSQLRQQYYAQQCSQHQIFGGCVRFEDGLIVASGCIRADMLTEVGDLVLYQLENEDEDIAWYKYKEQLSKGEKTFLEHIPSLAFRKKFGIATRFLGSAENMRYMKYFTPARQLQMVNTQEMRVFQRIEISQGVLRANTKEKVAEPIAVDVYKKRKLSAYFRDVDRYCKEMQDMSLRIHKEFCRVAFLRG